MPGAVGAGAVGAGAGEESRGTRARGASGGAWGEGWTECARAGAGRGTGVETEDPGGTD